MEDILLILHLRVKQTQVAVVVLAASQGLAAMLVQMVVVAWSLFVIPTHTQQQLAPQAVPHTQSLMDIEFTSLPAVVVLHFKD
jgi:hypothetical protein